MNARISQRLPALDILRGLAVAGMIVVTSPGSWDHSYWPLQHAEWHGWTPTDIIFPTFLFAVGMALALSFPKDLSSGTARSTFWLRVGRRVVALIILGLALNALWLVAIALGQPNPHPDATGLRLPGVPQRIALCYLLAAIGIVVTGTRDTQGRTGIAPRAIIAIIIAILIGYWALLTLVPVPGFGAGHLDPEGSLPAWLDRTIFGVPNLWPWGMKNWGEPVTYDPEGVLSTFPATVNVLFGVLAARELRGRSQRPLLRIAIAGAVLIAMGLAFDPLFPINKRLWTSSFALLSSGCSGLILVASALMVRDPRVDRLLAPIKILGGNAILAFTISIVVQSFWGLPVIRSGAERLSVQRELDLVAVQLLSDEYAASLAVAVTLLVVITVMIWPLHHRGVHVRL